jgi:hypothetical protein
MNIPWTALRTVGNSFAVKLTILIPVIGYLVLFNESLLRYFELSRTIFDTTDNVTGHGNVPSPVSLRLLAVYFGLCLVAVGSAIHQLFCPREIKTFQSAPNYVSEVLTNLDNISLTNMQDTLQIEDRNKVEQVAALVSAAERRTEGLQFASERYFSVWNEHKRDILGLYFDHLNYRAPLARYAATAFYVIGFAALAVPSLDVFIKVSRVLIRTVLD